MLRIVQWTCCECELSRFTFGRKHEVSVTRRVFGAYQENKKIWESCGLGSRGLGLDVWSQTLMSHITSSLSVAEVH